MAVIMLTTSSRSTDSSADRATENSNHHPDRWPLGPDFDYIRPRERVPSEPSVRTTLLAAALAFGMFTLFLWALPDLAAWISTWSWLK